MSIKMIGTTQRNSQVLIIITFISVFAGASSNARILKPCPQTRFANPTVQEECGDDTDGKLCGRGVNANQACMEKWQACYHTWNINRKIIVENNITYDQCHRQHESPPARYQRPRHIQENTTSERIKYLYKHLHEYIQSQQQPSNTRWWWKCSTDELTDDCAYHRRSHEECVQELGCDYFQQ